MDSSASLSPSIPAPYGRACVTCVRAKAKCTHQEGITKCHRCSRLHKECQPSPSFRRPGIKKKASTKTARLEEKLDGLVALLTAASKPHAGQAPTPGQLDASAALAQFGGSPKSLESGNASPGHEASRQFSSALPLSQCTFNTVPWLSWPRKACISAVQKLS